MKCYKNHFGMIVSAVLAVLMGLFMGISILLIEHRPINWVSLLDIWGDITLVVTLVLILMPLNEWGNKFAEKCRCRPGTVVLLLREQVDEIIREAEATSNKIYDEDDNAFIAHKTFGTVTVWTVYRREAGKAEVEKVYHHRMEIREDQR